jgi:hypothetical protein
MLLGPVLLTVGLRRAGAVPIWVPVLAVVFVVAGGVSGVAAGLVEKEALLAAPPPGVFHIPHFNRYPGVLVELSLVSRADLESLLLDAWLSQAPKDLAEAHRNE